MLQKLGINSHFMIPINKFKFETLINWYSYSFS